MRTHKDAKAMAKSLRDSLVNRNVSLTHSECLEIVAQQFGFADWNTLSSILDNEERRRLPSTDWLPHPPPAAPACDTFPDEGTPAIAICGDLKSSPVYIMDWRPGILSDPIELAGNGTYRIGLTPKEPREQVRHWLICRSCGSPGSLLDVVLTDARGKQLAQVNLVTLAHCMGVAIFHSYGVMVRSLPRKAAMFFSKSSRGNLSATQSNFSAAVIKRA
jgi:hypothetical protein